MFPLRLRLMLQLENEVAPFLLGLLEMTSKSLFKNRFVAFVDILGFQDIVQRMATTPELFDTVRDALTTIRDQSNAFGKYRAEKEARRTRQGEFEADRYRDDRLLGLLRSFGR
jgi:hypothetical protein